MTETNGNSLATRSVANDAKVKSFLDYVGLQVYTNEMQKWAGESLTKFEYTIIDKLPDSPYIFVEKQPRYIYMYDNDSDGTYELYMYVSALGDDAPSNATYELTKIGSIALDLADYYTKTEIAEQLKGYVHKEDDDYQETKQLAAKAATDAAAALKRAGEAESVAGGAAADASGAKAQVQNLAGRVAALEENGVGGGCDCTAIEESSIRGLFAALD